MAELAPAGFRTVAGAKAIFREIVVPYYLDDRTPRISIARGDDRLYAFYDLCPCSTTHARRPEVCSRGRGSCASVTAHGSISPPEP